MTSLGVTAIELPRARLGFRAGGVFSPRASAAEYTPRLGEVLVATAEEQRAKQKLLLVSGVALGLGVLIGRYTKK